ncbi:MAG: hypothetical protein R6W68_01625 [Ignavibacteriaceae bacterium]
MPANNNHHDDLPGLKFKDLNEQQIIDLRVASRFALRKIASAIGILKSAKSKISGPVLTHFKIGGITSNDIKDLEIIIVKYNNIAGALLGHSNAVFDGEKKGPLFGIEEIFSNPVMAYVNSINPPAKGEEGVIKIVKPNLYNPDNVKSSIYIETIARILIHEAAHRFAGCSDKKYYRGSTAIRIEKQDAMNNADSYANFAIPVTRL